MKLEKFLGEDTKYKKHTFFRILQKFLRKQQEKGLSYYSILHQFNSLYPLGEFLGNPVLADMTPYDLKSYEKQLWLKYATGTISPIIGDLRQFFRWCKRKGYHKRHIAKRLKKPRVRSRRKKAADDQAIHTVISGLAGHLYTNNLIYRDLFQQIQIAEQWGYHDIQILRDLFIIVFLYETGARASELTNLSTREMQAACETPQEVYDLVSLGKTHDSCYYFTEATAELWRVWEKVRPYSHLNAIYSWRNGTEPIVMRTNPISLMLVRRCKQFNATPSFRCHALRHAKVQRARRMFGMEIASQLIDHAQIETTYNYANIEDDEIKQAVLETGLTIKLWDKQGAITDSHP